MFTELYDELSGIDPKYRNRHLETTALVMGHTLDAIKHKTTHGMKRKETAHEGSCFWCKGQFYEDWHSQLLWFPGRLDANDE